MPSTCLIPVLKITAKIIDNELLRDLKIFIFVCFVLISNVPVNSHGYIEPALLYGRAKVQNQPVNPCNLIATNVCSLENTIISHDTSAFKIYRF